MSFWCRERVCGSAVMFSACFITYASTGSGEGRKHHCITPCTQPVPTFPMWWAIQNTVRHNNLTQGQFLPTGHHSDEHFNQSYSVNNHTTPEHPLTSIIMMFFLFKMLFKICLIVFKIYISSQSHCQYKSYMLYIIYICMYTSFIHSMYCHNLENLTCTQSFIYLFMFVVGDFYTSTVCHFALCDSLIFLQRKYVIIGYLDRKYMQQLKKLS